MAVDRPGQTRARVRVELPADFDLLLEELFWLLDGHDRVHAVEDRGRQFFAKSVFRASLGQFPAVAGDLGGVEVHLEGEFCATVAVEITAIGVGDVVGAAWQVDQTEGVDELVGHGRRGDVEVKHAAGEGLRPNLSCEGDVVLAGFADLGCCLPSDLHREGNFGLDGNAVAQARNVGVAAFEPNGVTGSNETDLNVAGHGFCLVRNVRDLHDACIQIGPEVKAETIGVHPILKVPGQTEVVLYHVVKVLDADLRSAGSDVTGNAPCQTNGQVQIEGVLEGIDDGTAVHAPQAGRQLVVVHDGQVGRGGPCRAVPWVVGHDHVFGGCPVEVDADGVEVAPSVAVLGFNDDVVGVSGVDGLVLEALVTRVPGAEEAQTFGVFDVDVVDDRSGGTHRNIRDVIVLEPGRTTVDGVARKVEAFDPNTDLPHRVATLVRLVVELCDIRGIGGTAVAVQGHHGVLLWVSFAVAVGVVLVLDPKVHDHRVRRRGQVLRNEAHLLVRRRNHPSVVVDAAPVLGQIRASEEDGHRKEVRLVGVDGEVERHSTVFVGTVLFAWAEGVATLVPDHPHAEDFVARRAETKVNWPSDVTTDGTADVVDLGPSEGDVSVDVVHGLLLKNQVVGGGVWGHVEVLKTHAEVDGQVPCGHGIVEVLHLVVGVQHLHAEEACIVLDGVAFRRIKQHRSGEAVNTVGAD